MKIEHDREGDWMYIRLTDKAFAKNRVIHDSFVLDIAEDGSIIGIEIISPSAQMDTTEIVYKLLERTAEETSSD